MISTSFYDFPFPSLDVATLSLFEGRWGMCRREGLGRMERCHNCVHSLSLAYFSSASFPAQALVAWDRPAQLPWLYIPSSKCRLQNPTLSSLTIHGTACIFLLPALLSPWEDQSATEGLSSCLSRDNCVPLSREKFQSQIKQPVRPHPCFISQLLGRQHAAQIPFLGSMNMNLGATWEMVRAGKPGVQAVPGVTVGHHWVIEQHLFF